VLSLDQASLILVQTCINEKVFVVILFLVFVVSTSMQNIMFAILKGKKKKKQSKGEFNVEMMGSIEKGIYE
jgi:hypothetical protein